MSEIQLIYRMSDISLGKKKWLLVAKKKSSCFSGLLKYILAYVISK